MSRLIVKEVTSKTILSKSQISEYTINPYGGCGFACSYCYGRFMKRFTGHREPWGDYVDVKINAPELLEREIQRKTPGPVWISGVCDPYQPLEAKYKLTRQCLKILVDHNWPVTIQTKSPLVLRDLDLLQASNKTEVTFSIGTADDRIRRIFEPKAPPIHGRIEALKKLHSAGIKTNAMIAPILPGASKLASKLIGVVDFVLIDRMNYSHANHLYREHHLEAAMTDKFFDDESNTLERAFDNAGVPYQRLF